MAQDGHQLGADATNGHGATPPTTATNPPGSPCESTNRGTCTPVPAVGVDAGNGKDFVAPSAIHGEERGLATGGSHTGGDLSRGKEVLAVDVTKGKAAADSARNAGNRAPTSHVMFERERRKRMKKMYDDMRAFLPNVDEKTDRASVVIEAIDFIRHLEDTAQKLEKQEQEQELALAQQAAADLGAGSSSAAPPDAAQGVLPQGWGWLPKKKQEQPGAVTAAPPRFVFQTWSEGNVVMNVCGDQAYITVCAPRRPGVLTMVLSVMEKHHIDVITAQIAGDDARTMFTIYTSVNVEEIKQLDAEPPESKDIYQLAVSEILVWLSSY